MDTLNLIRGLSARKKMKVDTIKRKVPEIYKFSEQEPILIIYVYLFERD